MFSDPLRQPPGEPAVLAGEGPAGYASDVVAAVDAYLARSLDELDETAIRAEMAVNEQLVRRLNARNADAAETLVRRQARRNQQTNPGDIHAGQKATRQVTDELRRDLQWTPSKTKQALRTARQLGITPAARDAYRDGTIPPESARVLADTLQHLDRDDRASVEPELLDAARSQDPVTFGRTCRATLAELNAAAAAQAAARRHQQRYGRASQDPDGTLRVSAGLTGLGAETFATALEAYRTTDTVAGESRTPDQRTADAVAGSARST